MKKLFMKTGYLTSRIMQIILFTSLSLLHVAVLYANEGEPFLAIINGTVVTSDGNPAASVTVRLKELNKITFTGEEGDFVFRNIKPGTYEIEVSLTGYQTVSQKVTVEKNKTQTIAISLAVSDKQLKEVVVIANKRFSTIASDDIAKMPLKNLDNAQVYTTITKELIKEQLIFSVDDAMRNATGVSKMWEATGRSGDGGSYYNARGFTVQSQLRNGIAGNISSRIDAANLEKIEVIKGPSATLFGSSLTSYGGLINRVTKKPYDHFGGEISYSTGSYAFNRISADINTPLDSAKKILFRLNTAYNYEGSFQDNGYNKNFVIAPSLSYQVNDRLSFLFDAEIYNGRNIVAPIFFFPFGQTIASMGVSRADQLSLDYKRSFTFGDVSQQSRNTNFFLQMNYKMSPHWTSQTNLTSTFSYSDGTGPYFYLLSNAAVTGNATDIGSDYISRNDQFTANSTDRALEVQQNFNGDFNIGGLRNRVVVGLDFFQRNSDEFFSGGTLDTIASHGDIPTYRNFNPISLQALYVKGGADFVYPIKNISNSYSAYAADVVNITANLIAMAALRVDHFVNKGANDITTGLSSGGYNQTALSPKFGLVFQPLKDRLSIFANYQNGFTNETGTDFSGKAFKPEQANQAEAGIKANLYAGRLTGTVSIYSIKVKDLIRTDVAHPNFSIQDGTQLSKGIEAEIIANPFQGMSIVAGFSYNDSKLEKADADVVGRRPATAMSPYTANLWLSYHLPQGVLRGLGFGFGGNYASDNKVVNSVSQGIFTLPAYTILNASIFYDQSKFRVGVKMDNLTDKEYWIGYTTVNPQKLRSFTGSIAFKF